MSSIPKHHQPAFPYFLHNHRVRRKRQRLPSNLVIENPRQQRFGFYLYMTRRGFPMNASGYTSTEIFVIVLCYLSYVHAPVMTKPATNAKLQDAFLVHEF
jgi:hypothetical protein